MVTGVQTCALPICSGPEVVVAAQPDAYGGLNANSPLWPQLVGAWQRYIDDVCDRTSDPLMLQTLYAQSLRDAATPQDVNAMQQFAGTTAGTSRLKTEKITDLRMTAELARMQTEYQTRYYKTFLDEQQRIYKTFQQGLKAGK